MAATKVRLLTRIEYTLNNGKEATYTSHPALINSMRPFVQLQADRNPLSLQWMPDALPNYSTRGVAPDQVASPLRAFVLGLLVFPLRRCLGLLFGGWRGRLHQEGSKTDLNA
jgi:hypothetical protein